MLSVIMKSQKLNQRQYKRLKLSLPMKPRNEDNFLIEVTPEQLDEINDRYRYVDEEYFEIAKKRIEEANQ